MMETKERPTYVEQIDWLKRRVTAMIRARDTSVGGKEGAASPIWQEVASVFGYLMELSPESLRAVRFHSGLINGGDLMRYWHPYPRINAEAEGHALGYARMIDGVPERFWMTEPPIPGIPRGLGVNYKGRIVNANIARYQNCISILYHAGAFNYLDAAAKRPIVVEIGGGYGGLAHGMVAALRGQATYVIVDLPEILMMSGAYLLTHHGDRSVWIYDEAEARQGIFAQNVLAHDIVLVPNYAADRLLELDDIAVFINMQSFQEMTDSQVTQYLDLVARKVSFCLFSDNIDCHPYNEQLSSIAKLLSQRFLLSPSPDTYTTLLKGIDRRSYVAYQKFIAQLPDVNIRASAVPPDLYRPLGLRAYRLRARLGAVEGFVRQLLAGK
jgi:hypothetical protein